MENTRPKGRIPLPRVPGLRNTTRRVAATFNPKAILERVASRGSLRDSVSSVPVEGPEDPDEPATILTSLASQPPSPLADLSSLLPVEHTFEDNDGFTALCNDLLILNAQQHNDPNVRSINIPGSRIFVSPYQLYHGYHLLTQRGRDLNGGILADNAGTVRRLEPLCVIASQARSPESLHNDAPVRFIRPLQPLVKTLSRGVESDLKNPSPASFIFITTLNSPRLWNVFSQYSLHIGLSVFDESHQFIRTKDSLTMKIASAYSGSGADVWFVTATPFSGCTLEHWAPAISLIAPNRTEAMRDLVIALKTAKSSAEADDAQRFGNLWDAVFDKKLVVRHFATSTFFGKSISDVQDIEPRIISRQTPAQYKGAIQQLANQIAPKDPKLRDPGQRGLLYFVSLFPAAAQMMIDNPIAFDNLAIRDLVRESKNRLRIEQSEPLQRLADQIIKESPKLDYILEELNRMGLDKREREPTGNSSTSKFGAGEDLQLKKMVIITPTAVSAIFLYLALVRKRKDVVIVHNWISSADKQQILTSFQSLSAAKLVKHNRILIAPYAAAGTGVNLQVASYQILTSPLPEKSSQVQAFARTNRAGQRLRPLSHKILVLEDSPVDRIMLARHATREIESNPFQISEPLRLAGDITMGNLVEPVGVVDEYLCSNHDSSLGVGDLSLLPESTKDEEGIDQTNLQSTKNDTPSPPSLHTVRESSSGTPDSQAEQLTTPQRPRTPSQDDNLNRLSSSSSSWQLTYTPLRPGVHNLGPRPLPPLPGPEPSSDEDPFMNTTPIPRRYRINVDQDDFKIWVSDSSSPLSENDSSRRPTGPLTVNLPADFSPSFGNIAAIVDDIRRGGGPTQRGKAINLRNNDDAPSSDLEENEMPQDVRFPGPIERPHLVRQYGDDMDPILEGGNRPVSVVDLPRPIGTFSYHTEEAKDQLEEDAHDAGTLAHRRRATISDGGSSRKPGQEFHRTNT
ncbi:hypothetical protein J7T55_014839 [Diaporthe amygdali]|uniref:uncharacterized protein n=1 Tax=Phomopsis amygdali TaxID=1214568 RepID=UPI0022FE6C50|nr:uncharacterized protein J7T55_014839 [Diaporthe amygdali]KAJ0110036.1 hypothetical protein J7T55_014839 [Diaporthe amygdali]